MTMKRTAAFMMKLLFELLNAMPGMIPWKRAKVKQLLAGSELQLKFDHTLRIMNRAFFRSISISGYSMIEFRVIVAEN